MTKRTAQIILIALTAVALSCTRKVTQTLPAQVAVETRTEYIHTERIDTCYIEIPSQTAERTTLDGYSHLETDYAESEARINADGSLTHTLNNKPQPKAVAVKTATDTVREYVEKPLYVEVPKEVERQLTRWEGLRIDTWAWLAAITALLSVWTFRKPVIAILTRILKRTP